MPGVRPDVAPVLRIGYSFLADRAVGVAALVVARKIGVYHYVAYSAFFHCDR